MTGTMKIVSKYILREEIKMEDKFVKISATTLSEIIGGLYYGSDEDLSRTEDLIEWLEAHPEQSVFVNMEK